MAREQSWNWAVRGMGEEGLKMVFISYIRRCVRLLEIMEWAWNGWDGTDVLCRSQG